MKPTYIPRIITVVTGVAALCLGLFAFLNNSQFSLAPNKDRLPLFFPYVTAIDDSGNSYVVDTAMRRLLALDNTGHLRWEKAGGQRSNGFYYAQKLAVDSKNRLYVYNWIAAEGLELKASEIQVQRYRPDGSLEKTVFAARDKSGSANFPAFFNFFIQADQLYYLMGDGRQLTFSRSDLDGGSMVQLRSIATTTDFVAIAGLPDGSLTGAARDGSLWQAAPDQDWVRLEIGGVKKPWDLKYDASGNLLILDLLRGEIMRAGSDGQLSTVLSTKETGGVLADSMAISPSGTIAVADKDRQALIVGQPGMGFKVYNGAIFPASTIVFRWLVWASLPLAGLAFLAALVLAIIFFLDRRRPLLLLQIGIFVPIIIASQFIAYNQVYSSLSQRYKSQVRDTLLNAANLTAKLLPIEAVGALSQPSDLNSDAYRTVQAAAKRLQDEGDSTGTFLYMALYRQFDGQPYYVYTGSGTFGVDYPYPYTLMPAAAKELFSRSGQVFAEYLDDYGMYEAAFASLDRVDGSSAGVVEIGLFADKVREVEDDYLAQTRLLTVINGIALVILTILLNFFLVRSINALRLLTREIAAGQLELPVELHRRDEMGQLSRAFGLMSGRLRHYMDNITALTVASARFVPRDFIDLLGVSDLTELKLGDQTRQDMAVMFSTVTNFQKVTSHLSSQGVFNFLNAYLGATAPSIRENRGVIDKFMGDTFMALFPRSPIDALTTFQQLNHRLRIHNLKRRKAGQDELRVSFGIHQGPLMLGIVGESERMEGTVIADAVNLTSRLNGLCRIYGVSCVTTWPTLLAASNGNIEDWKRSFPFRMLDHVMVKGKSEPILICEPLDERDPIGGKILKHLGDYEAAFAAWEAGRLPEAATGFARLAERIPQDPVIRRHNERCREFLGGDLPAVWNPAIKLTEK